MCRIRTRHNLNARETHEVALQFRNGSRSDRIPARPAPAAGPGSEILVACRKTCN
ncbi:hypothetical protein GCM10027447_21520 [Glycomyces halotolerans]